MCLVLGVLSEHEIVHNHLDKDQLQLVEKTNKVYLTVPVLLRSMLLLTVRRNRNRICAS